MFHSLVTINNARILRPLHCISNFLRLFRCWRLCWNWRIIFCVDSLYSIPTKHYLLLVPDELLIKCLVERLGQLDATKRGWVLHGFPSTRMQVDAMIFEGYEPNRVIVLDVPNDIVVERLSLRAVDPVSGER